MPRERTFSPLFILIAIIAVVTALYVAKQILLPVFLAVLLSFLLTPVARRMESWGLPRVPAVIAIVLIAFGTLAMLGWIVTAQVSALQAELPKHQESIKAKVRLVRSFSEGLHRFGEKLTNGDEDKTSKNETSETGRPDGSVLPDPEQLADPGDAAKSVQTIDAGNPRPLTLPQNEEAELGTAPTTAERIAVTGEPTSDNTADDAVPVKVVEMPPSPLTQAQGLLGFLAAPLTAAGMVFVLVFFMLLDRENQRDRLVQLFGASNLHTTTEALHDATRRVGRYLRMQFLINAGYGVAVAIGLWVIGVPSAIMWGVLGFALRFLPYLGPWLAATLPILVSLAVSDGWTEPIIVVCMYIIYELVLNNVAEPMLYGNSTGVSTVGVILSAIFWTWLWGPIGLILAMPMTVCLVVTARYVPQLRFLTVMLADQPQLSPAQRVYQRLLAFDYNEPLKMAHTHLKSSPLVNFYDEVLIPALILAEQDRHAGELNDEQEGFVREAAEDLVEELEDTLAPAESAKSSPDTAKIDATATDGDQATAAGSNARILCIPLRDDADETASCMLVQLLRAEGFEVHGASADALTSEVVDRVASSDSDMVVISVLPPIRPRDSRLLWKRLRHAYPNLPIIVGYWIGPDAAESLLPPPGDDASKVVTTLADAVALVRSTAAQRKLAKAV